MSGGARNGSPGTPDQDAGHAVGAGWHYRELHPSRPDAYRAHGDCHAGPRRASRISPAEVEARDYADDSPRANSIRRMVDAAEIGYLTVFLCSDKSWAVNGEVIAADGGGSTAVYY